MCYFCCLTTWDKCCSPPFTALGKLIFSWDSLCQIMKEAALNGSSNNRTQMVHYHAPGEQPGGIPLSLICTQRAENCSLPWGSPYQHDPTGTPCSLIFSSLLDSSNTEKLAWMFYQRSFGMGKPWKPNVPWAQVHTYICHWVCVGHQELLIFLHSCFILICWKNGCCWSLTAMKLAENSRKTRDRTFITALKIF